ncbi:MAG: alpha/beta hydrolase, partial [Myxococcales bacterium]|nr:alpha/beta hydrolase [Myxococcales bacterium]
AARYGGDPSRLVLAGESAGANLVTALTIATCQRRAEPWARALFDRGHVPRATVPACGLLQVSDPQRFSRGERPVSWFIHDRFMEVYDAYLGADFRAGDPAWELADPLCVLERDDALERPLPPFFVPCGTADPLLADTRRLARALARRGVVHEAPEYEGELHAFHALMFRPNARRCWSDTYRFLERTLA